MLSTSQDIQNTSGTDGLGTVSMTLVSSLDYFPLAFAFSSHLFEMWNLTFGKRFVFVSYFWYMGHQALENEGKAGEQLLCCKTGKKHCDAYCAAHCATSLGSFVSHERVTRALWRGRGQTGKNKVMVWHWNPLPRTLCMATCALSHRWGWEPWWFGYYHQRNTLTKWSHIPSCSFCREPSCSAQEASWTDNLLIHSQRLPFQNSSTNDDWAASGFNLP